MSVGSHRAAVASAGASGVVVVVPEAAVLLPAGVADDVVAAVWRILAAPAAASAPALEAESVVAALPLRGAAEVAAFGVVVHEEAGAMVTGTGIRLSVVLRGDAVLDVATGPDEVRRVDARAAVPFYLASIDRVTAYRLGWAGDPVSAAPDEGLPLVAGAVATAWTSWDAAGEGPGLVAAPPVGPLAAALTATVRDAPAAPDAPPAPVAAAFAPADADPPAAPGAVLRRRGAHALPDAVTDADRPARAADRPGADRPAGARARRAAEPVRDDDRMRAASVATVATPTLPEDDADAPHAVYAFRIAPAGAVVGGPGREDAAPDDRIPLDVPAVIGRRPRPPRVVRGADPRLVSVPSPLGEISGTHVGLRQESGTVVVTDLHSTNGTVVLAPGAERLALRPGESLVVVPGTRIDIGDGTLLEILPAR